MKRTEFANLVLVAMEDLNNLAQYYVQAIKERSNAATTGTDPTGVTTPAYNGIVKSSTDLLLTSISPSPNVTITTGAAYTRFDPTSVTQSSNQYNGGERVGLASSIAAPIKNTSGHSYFFLVYAELRKSKKYDESGVNAYFVDRPESYLVVQMTAAEATALGSYTINPTGTVTVTNVAAPHLDSVLSNAEKSATFSGWTYLSGVFTVTSFTVTQYNSVYLGHMNATAYSAPNVTYTVDASSQVLGSSTFSRPLFSTVDQLHRTQLGRGTSSTTNPHGMLIQDLGNLDDIRELISSGIIPKFTGSLACVVNGVSGNVVITNLSGIDYLFMDGKRVTTVSPLTIAVSGMTAGINYVYVQILGTVQTQGTAPWNYYIGSVVAATSVPSSNAFVLCSVYVSGGIAYAYNGDTRYVAGSTTNPVTDLRVFGVDGYDYLHSTLYESINKENMIPNGSMQASERGKIKGWVTGAISTLLPASGSTALYASAVDDSLLFPFDANIDYAFRVKVNTRPTPSTTGASTYTIKLLLFRGKDRSKDLVGQYTLVSEVAQTHSTWFSPSVTDFLSGSAISASSPPAPGTFDPNVADRSAIGWACIEITPTVGVINLVDMILRPKMQTSDISNLAVTTAKIANAAVTETQLATSVAGYALTGGGGTPLSVVADESSLTVDTVGDLIKIKPAGVTTSHVNTSSEIGRVIVNGTVMLDSAGENIGSALRLAFGGVTYYVPGWTSANGCGCTCTCTGNCGCTCTCAGDCGCTGTWGN
jgi:hypothetical protein